MNHDRYQARLQKNETVRQAAKARNGRARDAAVKSEPLTGYVLGPKGAEDIRRAMSDFAVALYDER